jgi:hypothetical protein
MCKQKFVLSNNTFPKGIPFPMKKSFSKQSETFAKSKDLRLTEKELPQKCKKRFSV